MILSLSFGMDLVLVSNCKTIVGSSSCLKLQLHLISIGSECASLIFGVDDGKTLPQLSAFLMSEIKGHINCVLWYNQKQKVQSAVDKTVNNVAAINSIYVS